MIPRHRINIKKIHMRTGQSPRHIRIQYHIRMRMKHSLIFTIHNHVHTRWLGETEDTETWLMARWADDCDGFGEHELVGTVGVEVDGGHEAWLRWVGLLELIKWLEFGF